MAKVNKRLVNLDRVKARAALRVKQRFAQIELEEELKAQENKAVAEAVAKREATKKKATSTAAKETGKETK